MEHLLIYFKHEIRDLISLTATSSRELFALLREDLGKLSFMRGAKVTFASSKATFPGRRRVLHFLFGPPSPGYGLRWRHVA
jgi:hypothetical protein